MDPTREGEREGRAPPSLSPTTQSRQDKRREGIATRYQNILTKLHAANLACTDFPMFSTALNSLKAKTRALDPPLYDAAMELTQDNQGALTTHLENFFENLFATVDSATLENWGSELTLIRDGHKRLVKRIAEARQKRIKEEGQAHSPDVKGNGKRKAPDPPDTDGDDKAEPPPRPLPPTPNTSPHPQPP
jgi:hypothetical protein